MQNTIYLTVILFMAAFSAVIGFRRGFTGQLASLLSLAFGAVGSRILTPRFAPSFEPWVSDVLHEPFVGFSSELFCAVCIYIFIYALFSFFTGILNGAVSVFRVGMFNRLSGSFFCIFKNLLWVSIAYTVILSLNPESGLLKYARQNDGNVISAVMELTPAILGCNGANDLAHLIQMKEAAKISCNFPRKQCVIINRYKVPEKNIIYA